MQGCPPYRAGRRAAPAHPQPFQGLHASGWALHRHCWAVRRLIILDEPTVGLDPAQVIEIRKLIRELGRAHTVILSSHILSEVQAVCQQILILSKGHLAAAGSLEELTADGKSLEEVFLELTDGEPEEATGEEDAE